MRLLQNGYLQLYIKLITENPTNTHPEKQKTLKKKEFKDLTHMISFIVMITTVLQDILVQICLCK